MSDASDVPRNILPLIEQLGTGASRKPRISVIRQGSKPRPSQIGHSREPRISVIRQSSKPRLSQIGHSRDPRISIIRQSTGGRNSFIGHSREPRISIIRQSADPRLSYMSRGPEGMAMAPDAADEDKIPKEQVMIGAAIFLIALIIIVLLFRFLSKRFAE